MPVDEETYLREYVYQDAKDFAEELSIDAEAKLKEKGALMDLAISG
jgi:hypothetical protein